MPEEDRSIDSGTTVTQDTPTGSDSGRVSASGGEDAGGSSSAQDQIGNSVSVTSPERTEPYTKTVPNDDVGDTIADLDDKGCQLLSVLPSQERGKGWTDISYQAVPR
ncbi:hypothetical protein L202_00908 [Cryptococcus amylolentus CBS 6039]|uniref:Uncharacterized protein n=1 Tax=Cryptococcus amylolentus CBS 6039 TaxID=1295533 RepID=A0A1E3IBE0_9TREE|nr:hypothetical protein L202_00908 [Cryptococcus amylolentus CBS 6039]ODN85081.1 hypothetical protein L202_00908 [Cryptococcus amylolentus CBS 6039]